MQLYEIKNEYLSFMRAVEDGLIPEEAFADTLEGIVGEIEDKADNIACVIKSIDAEILAIKAEEDRLADRRKAKESRKEWLKNYLSEALINCGLDKVETARNKITFRKSEAVEISEGVKLPERFITVKTTEAPNKTELKNAIKSGEIIEGVILRTNQNIQIK